MGSGQWAVGSGRRNGRLYEGLVMGFGFEYWAFLGWRWAKVVMVLDGAV